MAIFNSRIRLVLSTFIVSLIFLSCESAADHDIPSHGTSVSGNKLYEQNCMSCHGKKGDLGVSGATDLTQSQKTLEEKVAFIKTGSGDGIMQAYGVDNGGHLSDEEIEKIANFVETLKK